MSNFASKDLTAGQLNALVKKVGGRDNVLAVLTGALKFQLLTNASQEVVAIAADAIVVQAGTLAEAITRKGYDWVNSDIIENRFYIANDQVGDFEYEVFHFGHNISSESAIKAMKAKGFDPAQSGQILAYGEAFPEQQRKYPIVALGSVTKMLGRRLVLVLDGDGSERRLDLSSFGDNWVGDDRFLGVRRCLPA